MTTAKRGDERHGCVGVPPLSFPTFSKRVFEVRILTPLPHQNCRESRAKQNIFLLLRLSKRVGWHHFVPLSKNRLLNNPVGHFPRNRLNLVPSHAPFHNHLKYLLSLVPCVLMQQNDMQILFMA